MMNKIGQICAVTGWGRTANGYSSEYLQQVYLSIVEPSICIARYKGSALQITENQLCAGSTDAKDSCLGDSGGPFVCRRGSVWYQSGIVSAGPSECALEGIPGVYTSVFKYRDWIKAKCGV
jgi:secreted trypsin-like serine protease